MKNKKILTVAGVIVLVFFMLFTLNITKRQPDSSETIVLLHTNDVHGAVGNYGKVAALKEQCEKDGSFVLLMDAGDFTQGDPVVNESRGRTAVELMNLCGYDAAALGNHEFDYGYENIESLESVAEFPFLSANVLREGRKICRDHVIFKTPGGWKIGVFGIDTPETATKAHPERVKGITFLGQDSPEDLYGCAQEQVDLLKKENCDLIVCLSHLGVDLASEGYRSTDLLENVTGIDLLIDGHSHTTLEEIKELTDGTGMVNGAYITSAGKKLENIGKAVIRDGAVTGTENIPVEELEIKPLGEVEKKAAEMTEKIEKEYGVVFAASEVDLEGEKEKVRTMETNLGNLIADAMLWGIRDAGIDCDVAITNGGSIRESIPKGEITKKQIHTVLPFSNELSVVRITGAELLEALEASTFSLPEAVGGFPQVAGMEFSVNTGEAYDAGEDYPDSTYKKPKTIKRVTVLSINGQPFEEDRVYSVATNDFLACGGDTYHVFKTAVSNINLGMPMDEAVIRYISEELDGAVSEEQYGKTEGRIQTEDH